MTGWNLLGHFVHGLIFFTLGLAMLFSQYRSRRILLAAKLHWLSIFALCEALVAWNRLFAAVHPATFHLPPFVATAILALGYAFLLVFGLQTLRPDLPRKLVLIVQGAWVIPYAVTLILAHSASGFDTAFVATGGEILARYVLAFPGGVLTAIGLRKQSYHALDAELRQKVRPYLQLFEVMMGAFGVLNLILVPVGRFFPATWLNADLVPAFLANWLWALVGIGLTWGLFHALHSIQQHIEQWIEGVERLQALAVDRERIGRDLHDGIIQSIYASGLLLESVQPIIPKDPMRAQAQLGRVMDNLNETIQDIRRYIFDLRSDMPDDKLGAGIERLLRDFRINTLLETDFNLSGDERPISSMERRRHIFQIVREALANTAKHAQATWVEIDLAYGEEALELTICDDGVGMATLLVSKGYGLRNIRERARMLDGTLRIESAPGKGVTFNLTVPY